jgi:hypothetical protein
MKTLHRQHKAVMVAVFTTLAGWYYYFYYHYKVPTNPEFRFIDILSISFSAVAGAVILFYETFAWRWFNPRLDFSGEWGFTETQFAIDPTTGEFQPAFDAWGVLTITEDVSSIGIAKGETFIGDGEHKRRFSTWHSMACDLNEDGNQLFAALDHTPVPGGKGGDVKYGIEIFTVTNRQNTWLRKGRPLTMTSEVLHSIERGAKAHRVSVDYIRLPRSLKASQISSQTIRNLRPAPPGQDKPASTPRKAKRRKS